MTKIGIAWKRTIVRAGFFLVGRTLQSVSRTDERLAEELESFPQGSTVVLRVEGENLAAVFRRDRNAFRYLGSKPPLAPELAIRLKNLTSAYLLIVTAKSLPATYAEHRVAVSGNVSRSIAFTRCLYVAEAYIYPRFLARRVMPEVPEMGWKRLGARLRTLFAGIPFGK